MILKGADMKKTIFILIIFYMIYGNLNAAERRRFEKHSLERDPNAATHSHHGSSTDELFDLQFVFPLGVGDGEAGIECDGNYFYTTKWNGNAFYKYELDGTYIGEFTVEGCPGSIRDLAYDGQYFYGAAADNTVYEMDFENQIVISTIAAPITVRAIAYDENADAFWANNWSTNITLFDRNGTTLDSFPCGYHQSYYGFAWENVLSGGPYLWGYCQDGASINQLVQFDIATGLETGINFDISNATPLTGIAGGLFISEGIVPYAWTIGGLCQNDVIWGLELGDYYCPPPGAPTDVLVIPDVGGALITVISWICPTLDATGFPLQELLEMRVYRDNELIYTDFEPVIGGPGNCTDINVPSSGLYDYRVVGYNNEGEGIPVIETVWVGEDVPAAVDNLFLEDISIGDTLMAQLTWDNPTTGLHGGAFNEPILGYHILRHPDNIAFELTGIHTEWIDDTIPIPGYYYYDFTPYNSVGDGGTATSTYITPVTYIYENFSGGVPPSGWFINGLGEENWSSSQTNYAGGSSPEARLNYSPTFIGTSRLVSSPVYSVGATAFNLSFAHYLDLWEDTITLKVETTSDTINWYTVWEISPTASFGPQTESFTFTSPDLGSTDFRIAFTFEGDSFNLNQWYIDDILGICQYAFPGYLCGNVSLFGGLGNIEEVEIIADGSQTNPDENGDYSLELWPGVYEVYATLNGYYPDIETGILVLSEDTTYVDMELYFLEPPFNLTFEIVAPHVVLNWNAPLTVLYVTGYKVYRDNELIAETTELYFMDGNVPFGTHEYFVTAKYDEYESGPSNIIVVEMTETDISLIPLITELKGNHPNPFNPSTTIEFSIQNNSEIELVVYNIKGQKIKTLAQNEFTKGSYSIIWNGDNESGNPVSSGLYLYKLNVNGKTEAVKKCLLLK